MAILTAARCGVVAPLLLVADAFTTSLRSFETSAERLDVQQAIPSTSFRDAPSGLQRMLSPDCELAPSKLIMMAEVEAEFLDNGMFANWYQSAYPFLHSSIQFLFDVPDLQAKNKLQKLEYLPDDVLILNDKMDIVPLFESSSNKSDPISALLFRPPWGSKEYHDLMARRPTAVKLLLEKKCSVLSFDIDTWWVRNPFDEIASKDHDLLITDDSRYNDHDMTRGHVCGCFLFMKPTPPVLKVAAGWIQYLNSYDRRFDRGNQDSFNFALNDNKDNVDYAFLPFDHFPPGVVVTEGRHSPSEVVLYHANWVHGIEEKIAFLSKLHMWHPEKASKLRTRSINL